MTILLEDVTNKLGQTFTKLDDEEVEGIILDAKFQAIAYLEKKDIAELPTGALVDNAISTWAAGLLWNKKMDSKNPNYHDDRRGLTTGDKKIQEAKDMLKPYLLGDADDDGLPDSIHIFTIDGSEDEDEELEDIIVEDDEEEEA